MLEERSLEQAYPGLSIGFVASSAVAVDVTQRQCTWEDRLWKIARWLSYFLCDIRLCVCTLVLYLAPVRHSWVGDQMMWSEPSVLNLSILKWLTWVSLINDSMCQGSASKISKHTNDVKKRLKNSFIVDIKVSKTRHTSVCKFLELLLSGRSTIPHF